MGLGLGRKKRKEMALQLTSLLDMFTIILVFLLESFQAQDEDFTLKAGLELPSSTAKNPFKSAVNISVSMDQVFVEGKPVHELEDGGGLKPEDMERGQLEAVTDEFNAAWDSKPRPEGEDRVATIQADESLPYETINVVMRSAAYAGCFRYRLVVTKE